MITGLGGMLDYLKHEQYRLGKRKTSATMIGSQRLLANVTMNMYFAFQHSCHP